MRKILILGGTTEASQLATRMAAAGIAGVLSYAGRTETPAAQALPIRIGGFGGAAGLEAYLRADNITHLVDATHPFAARISRNALEASARAGIPLLALERPEWSAQEGDLWTHVPDIAAAAAALPQRPHRVFLAIGRLHLGEFAALPQHDYLLRLVDPPQAPLPLPQVTLEIARGPFTLAQDLALLKRHGSQIVVAKNAGGSGALAKLQAARALGLPVILIDRPALPARRVFGDVAALIAALHADLGV